MSRWLNSSIGQEGGKPMTKEVNERVHLVESRILLIRGEKVIIDADLAELYGVTTKRLNEQVKRNRTRFPSDFAFRLNVDERNEVVANCDHLATLKFSPVMPTAFTEHGAIMAATILNSDRAVEMSVFVVRAFVQLRRAFLDTAALKARLEAIDQKLSEHDSEIATLVAAIRRLLSPTPVPKPRRIGFNVDDS